MRANPAPGWCNSARYPGSSLCRRPSPMCGSWLADASSTPPPCDKLRIALLHLASHADSWRETQYGISQHQWRLPLWLWWHHLVLQYWRVTQSRCHPAWWLWSIWCAWVFVAQAPTVLVLSGIQRAYLYLDWRQRRLDCHRRWSARHHGSTRVSVAARRWKGCSGCAQESRCGRWHHRHPW